MSGYELTIPLLAPILPHSHTIDYHNHLTIPTINSPRPPTPFYTPLDSNLIPRCPPHNPPRNPFVTPRKRPRSRSPTHHPLVDSDTLPIDRLHLDSSSPAPMYQSINPFVNSYHSDYAAYTPEQTQYYQQHYHLDTPRRLGQRYVKSYAQPRYSVYTPCPQFGPRPTHLIPGSLEQIRRTTRRADENAAPPALTRLKSSSAAAPLVTAGKTSTTTSTNPVLKRAHSAVTTSSAAATTKPAATKPVVAGTKRSALGEVTNAGKKDLVKGGKGKDEGGKEKKALQQTSSAQNSASTLVGGPARRTRSSGASTLLPLPAVEPAAKKRIASRIPVASRSRSTTASTSTTVTDSRLRERKLNIALEVKDHVEPEPARKKRKTSSPALEEEAPSEVNDDDDLADDRLYDEDGREIVLSSGGRGTRCRSPERRSSAKDAGWTDLDAEDDGDPNMVSEYVVDAFEYMLSIEVSYPNLMQA